MAGGKIGMFGGAGVGKTVVIQEIYRGGRGSTRACRCSPAWGSVTREGNDLFLEMTETGVIDKTALIFGQMDEPPGVRLRVGLAALTVAEYFRDELGQDVLLFIDNIFRFVQAGSEVSTLLGRMPSAVGYQPTLAGEMGELQERITSTWVTRSPRCRPSTCPPTTSPTRPCTHLRPPGRDHGAAREIASSASTRRSTRSPRPRGSSTRGTWARSSTTVARRVQEILQRYNDLQDIIAILGVDELSEDDKVIVNRLGGSSGSCPSPSTWPSSSPACPARRCRWTRPSPPSTRWPRATTTTCPSRPSSTSAGSRRPRRRPSSSARIPSYARP